MEYGGREKKRGKAHLLVELERGRFREEMEGTAGLGFWMLPHLTCLHNHCLVIALYISRLLGRGDLRMEVGKTTFLVVLAQGLENIKIVLTKIVGSLESLVGESGSNKNLYLGHIVMKDHDHTHTAAGLDPAERGRTVFDVKRSGEGKGRKSPKKIIQKERKNHNGEGVGKRTGV